MVIWIDCILKSLQIDECSFLNKMKLLVNGKELNLAQNLTVSELLTEQNVKMPDMVSVELNGQILKSNIFV